MDSRLIPPSHFDPSEVEDSLDLATPSDENRKPVLMTPGFPIATSHLITPEDFSSGNQGLEFPNNTRSHPYHAPPAFRSGHYGSSYVSRRDLFPNVSGMLPAQNLPNFASKHSDLVKLRTENETLKSILEGKRKEQENKFQQQASNQELLPAHQAVIEHQTQHIARLQQDLDKEKSLLVKKENEILQLESSLAAKEVENRRLQEDIAVAQSQVYEKDETLKNREGEILNLQALVQRLNGDIEQLKDSNSTLVKNLEENFEQEKDALNADIVKKTDELATKHNEEKAHLYEQLDALKNNCAQKVEKLTKSHESEKINWGNTMEEIKKCHLANITQMEKNLAELKACCDNAIKAHTQEKEQKKEVQSELDDVRVQLEASHRDSEKHLARVNQLQAYISQLQSEDYERCKWKAEKERLEGNVETLQEEKDSLNKTLELQNVRLQSITKILTTQEEAINANTKAFSSDNVKGNLAAVVVRRWREKVLELMIRNKSDEIMIKNMENSYKLAESDVKEQLEDEKRIGVILENQVTESKALLEMKEREIAQLETRNKTISEAFQNSSAKATELEKLIATISTQVASSTSSIQQLHQQKMDRMTEKLIHVEQRLVFANNRMKTLQDLYQRRENLWKAKLKAMTENNPSVQKCDVMPEQTALKQIDRPDLEAEIRRLTEERDSLSQKLSNDAALFESATAQFKSEEAKLMESIAVLQNEIQNKNEVLAELRASAEKMGQKLSDKARAASEAEESLRSFVENQEKVIEQKLDEAWRQWHEEKKELLHKLEESQREHARTVVTARQSERSVIREKKRAAENLEAIAAEHKVETENLRAKINSVKLDNNLLMTTLRQHNLVSSYKSARKEARLKQGILKQSKLSPRPHKVKTPQEQTSFSQAESSGVSPLSKSMLTSKFKAKKAPQASAGNEPLTVASQPNMEELLKDLVTLTENILDDPK